MAGVAVVVGRGGDGVTGAGSYPARRLASLPPYRNGARALIQISRGIGICRREQIGQFGVIRHDHHADEWADHSGGYASVTRNTG